MLPIDAIILIFWGYSLGLMTYMVMLMKRLIDDSEGVNQNKNNPTWGLGPSKPISNKRTIKMPRPPLPPPPRPKDFPESEIWE